MEAEAQPTRDADCAARFPPVVDESGYDLRAEDFRFLDIEEGSAWACHDRQAPLGISINLFSYFIDELAEALNRESLRDADVRLQGSSTSFFSNPLKKFPASTAERAQLFMVEHGRMAQAMELVEIEDRIANHWATVLPIQRPFDSLYKLGLSPDRSDIDVQISSGAAFDIAHEIARMRGIDPKELRVTNEAYDFLIKEISDTEFLYLARWASRWIKVLDRGVSIAIFDSAGPPRREAMVSSHFRPTDWVLPAKVGVQDVSGERTHA